jgi:hypothetical protein
VTAIDRFPDGDGGRIEFLGPLAARATHIALTDDHPFTIAPPLTATALRPPG